MADEPPPPPPPRTLRTILAELPPALVVALGLILVLGTASTAYRTHLFGGEHWGGMGWARLRVLGHARWFTVAVFMAIGFGQLRARTSGGARTLLTVAVVALAAAVTLAVVDAYFTYYDPPRGRWVLEYSLWQARIDFGLWLVAGGCLAAALGGRGQVGLALGGLALIGIVLEHPLHALADLYYFDDYRRHAWANATITIVLLVFHVSTLAAAAWWLGREAPAPTRPGALADGLARLERALVARVIIAIAAALFTMMALGGRSLTMMKLVLTVVPLAVLITQILVVVGLLQAASGPGAARARLTWAAGLSVLVSLAGWCQAVAAFVVARARWNREGGGELDDVERFAQVWPYALPAVGVLGLLLLLWAIDDVRRSTPYHDPPAPLAAGVWTILGTASALALPHLLRGERVDAGDLMIIALVVAAANVVATLAVARACGKAAAALRNVPP